MVIILNKQEVVTRDRTVKLGLGDGRQPVTSSCVSRSVSCDTLLQPEYTRSKKQSGDHNLQLCPYQFIATHQEINIKRNINLHIFTKIILFMADQNNSTTSGREEEEVDPVEAMINKTGCLQLHYAVQECIGEKKDWRQCQKEVTEFRKCMEQGRMTNATIPKV
ncbi:hypothetical protein Btru_071485 [Bulinus truncatus]|nr:hypothetical protein Btru_071485 [Bulinus truncatus]